MGLTLQDIIDAIKQANHEDNMKQRDEIEKELMSDEPVDCQLGDEVFDRISGFRGTVTAICMYLGASTQVEVTRQDDALQKWLSLDRLELHKGEDYE